MISLRYSSREIVICKQMMAIKVSNFYCYAILTFGLIRLAYFASCKNSQRNYCYFIHTSPAIVK